jgi:hypothetical protein
MKDLEAENAKLKRMYAELALEHAAIKDVLSRKRTVLKLVFADRLADVRNAFEHQT